VKGLDDNLARLFSYLEETGQMENTVIIYTSDQGLMLGEHDYIDKRWMYEESMRMPLIIHYPKKIKAGIRADLIVNNTDFAPTMIEMAGGTAPAYMHGKSLKKLLIEGKVPDHWRDATYYRYWMHLMHHTIPAHFGIRTKEYKLIFYYGLPYDTTKIGTKSMPWMTTSYTIEKTPVAWEFYDLKKILPKAIIDRAILLMKK
jgi:arylsulfatase A-like enzyme